MRCAYCSNRIRQSAEIPLLDIPSLLKTLNSTNKTYRICFTGGGEPLLVNNIVDACIEISKKHFVSLHTNLTTSRIAEFSDKIDPERVIFIIASLHIKELERLNLLDTYLYNFHLLRNNGFTIVPSVVAYPPLLDEIGRYKEFFKERELNLHFDLFQGVYNGKKYPDSYTEEEMSILGLNIKEIGFVNQKRQLCNAGYNAGIINPKGNVFQCGKMRKPMGNIYKKIEFNDNLIRCPFNTCGSPLNIYDPYLFGKAKKTMKSSVMHPTFSRKYFFICSSWAVAKRYLPHVITDRMRTLARKCSIL